MTSGVILKKWWRIVSFYGASYVHIGLQDASSSTNIYIRFKTHRSDALLLLAAGTTDYCLVSIQDGSVKVRINLGAGESELSSPSGLRVDDLAWHEIEIQREEAELSLVIDGIHTTQLFISGSFYELNVHFGVFCGGLGDFSELFLGNLDYFRGCMDEVSFNDYDVLGSVPDSSNDRTTHLITWDCSDEFSGIEEDSISFMDKGAFLALPQMIARTGGSISFEIKTQSQTAVVLYHSGIPSKSDFVAVELINGVAQMLVNKGNGVVQVLSNVTISDGYWHKVHIMFGPEELDLTVDSVATNIRTSQRGSRFIDLSEYLYIGGIELNKQSRALRQGLKSVDEEGTESSMKGCLKDLKINGKPKGLLEAEVTQGLRSGCVWEYPCLLSPCIEGAECYQESYDNFRCFCDAGELCIRHDYNETYTLYTKSTFPVDMEILAVHPLQIPESGSELITTDLIEVILHYQRYGIRESGVMFHIIEPPKYGALVVEILSQTSENVFTLLDLNTDKVRYTHYGSDNHHDTITFDIQFVAHSHRLPPFLEHNHKFVFHINITPVNDPPTLYIAQNKVLKLATSTRKLITADYLQAKDTDSPPSKLVYTIINTEANEMGYVENVKNPGEPILTFTQQDINNGLISYVHTGIETDGRLSVSISDGFESGDMAVLRVATFDLYISLANNTGLTVIHGASEIISSNNLTFITNAIDQKLDISYDITRMPQHGTVQRLKSNGRWQVTSRFTQKQIDHRQIRYIHAGNSKPRHDRFHFVVSTTSTKQSTVYDFTISFITVDVQITGSKKLFLPHINEAPITQKVLNVETQPDIAHSSGIGFQLVKSPEHGGIYVQKEDGQFYMQHSLQEDFAFTLQDIREGKVLYRLKWRMFKPTNDSFNLMATTPGGIENDIVITMFHKPERSDVTVVLEPLVVTEGKQAIIGPDNLIVSEPNVTSFIFNITKAPLHGYLIILDDSLIKVEVTRPDVVGSSHIRDGRLAYVHDDSENSQDAFDFVATAGEWSHSKTRLHSTLKIEVIMTNDNPPFRVVDKTFHVVKFGQRIITRKDVLYSDKDIDTRNYDIQYTSRGISNGKMVYTDTPELQAFQFTQEDIDDGKIMFQHNGELHGRTVLWVTDGQFYTTGILNIEASDPFLKISTNLDLIVKHGDSQVISSNNLEVTTNIDVGSKDVVFTITKPPKYGQITKRGISSLEFTQFDLQENIVEYESDTALEFIDYFDFEVNAGRKVKSKGQFKVKIYPESYWKPFIIFKNETLNVSESKSKLIDQTILKISHANVDPHDIQYEVVSSPKHGSLFIGNIKNVKQFNQSTIDSKQLKYEQDGTNATNDVIVFNTTNGVNSLNNLALLINIIPSRVFLLPKVITVLEGDKVPLGPEQFIIGNAYYRNSVRDYLITTKPKYGRLRNKRKPKKRITRFSPSQLRKGLIHYVHDGSETQKDRFSIVAVVSTENGLIRSSPGHLDVIVLPVDDQAPRLVNNTGLMMWSGSTVTLTSENLAAIDVDSQVSDIHFRIVKSSDIGYFGLISTPDQFMTSIPQSEINDGLVRFFHTGGDKGSFVFELSDRVNIRKDYITFKIKAKPIELFVENKNKLQVFPQMQVVITNHHLSIAASGNVSSHDVIYEVITSPAYGKLLVNEGDKFDHVTEFTQEEIDQNLILYQSTGKKFVNDSISFRVSNEHSQKSLTAKLPIEISAKISKDNLRGILKPVEVLEGGRAIISNINVNITKLLRLIPSANEGYTLKDARLVIENKPKHGVLTCGKDQKFRSNGHCELTAKQLANGNLIYQHDHSDTFTDSIDLTLKLIDETDNAVDLVNVTLDIHLIPVDDNNFEFLTKSPKIDVVFGMTQKITKDNLQTEDPDGIPDAIVYEMINDPSNGKIVLIDDDKNAIAKFSQKDIDDGKLFFVHDGKTDNNGIFTLKIHDGNPSHKPVYKKCEVIVRPLTLGLTNKSDIELLQGEVTVILSNDIINVQTNGNRNNNLFIVQVAPKFGELKVGKKMANKFSQSDIDKKKVKYTQTDLSGSEDSFTLKISNLITELKDQVFHIKVVPLVKQYPFEVKSTSKAFLTLDSLDASELARRTDSNPMYNIIRPPEFGMLQKVRERPYRSTEHLKSFTHSDVKNNLVYYKPTSTVNLPKSDKIVFLLSAQNVQPAKGQIDFNLIAQDSPISGGNDPSTPKETGDLQADDSIEEADSEIGVNYILIIAVVLCLLVFFIIIAIIIFKCLKKPKKSSKGSTYSNNKLHKNGAFGMSDDLPPPPTTITPPMNRVKRKKPRSVTPPVLTMYTEEDNFAEISAAVPMCKVTPLKDYHLSNTHKVKSRYEHDSLYSDDLSSNSNGGNDNQWPNLSGPQETQFSPPSNPLLRKNQYWV
ncbi:Chondroitin sulfate proteoglycan 4 [Nymphon striatum]|nr:Chondroitin sulfate proteoglycan 4 [Nymphon striatum]